MGRATRHTAGHSTKAVSASLTPREFEAWKKSAAALDVSMSDLIRQSVNYYLEARAESLRSRVKEQNPRKPVSEQRSMNPRDLTAAAPPVGQDQLTAVKMRFHRP